MRPQDGPTADSRCRAGRLIDLARSVIRIPDPELVGTWPRAAAVLGRQALEAALTRFWDEVEPGVERESMRAQLLCLPGYTDHELARRVCVAWHGLSHACHHQAWEPPPTAPELHSWLDDIETFIRAERGRFAGVQPHDRPGESGRCSSLPAIR